LFALLNRSVITAMFGTLAQINDEISASAACKQKIARRVIKKHRMRPHRNNGALTASGQVSNEKITIEAK
jgi:hypothetical protein